MMSFENFKKQFDKSLSEKTNKQILSEIEKLGHELVDIDKSPTSVIPEKLPNNQKGQYCSTDNKNNYALAA